MKKQSILLLSSLLAGSLLIGATFAAYAVTDKADPFGINVTPGNNDEDTETNYVTIRWGESTSKSGDISNAAPGNAYKLGVYSLVASQNYQGVLSVELADSYDGVRPEGQKKFISYLSLYLYEGAVEPADENELPSEEPLLSSAQGATSLVYGTALGTPAGKEYTLYIKVSDEALYYLDEMSNDVVDITINWDAKAEDVIENSHTVYYSTSWENTYLYTWGDSGCNHNYPGVEMSKIGINQYGQYVYQGLLLAGYNKMIFSNGGQGSANQTPDLLISDFDFGSGDLLFWRDDEAPKKAGYKVFESSDVTTNKANMGSNPGPILQAFGWTTNTVLSRLDDIKAAGYKAIQLSPLQPMASNSTTQNWAMAYQPLGFSVATTGHNPFGDKTSLIALTEAAEEKGIDIIVDVVANHLKEGSSERTLDIAVRDYEQTIYDNNLIHTQGWVDGDGNTELIVRGSLGGLPDLQTENSHVQSRVIAMLKEYIDCGVKGFRFDAAKHIETPTDGYFASEFWPNVIGAINQYGLQTYNKAPYCYGEILGVGSYRDWNGYTKYIDVTDYGVTWQTRDHFNNSKDEGDLLNHLGYTINQGADYALMFAESHDNFLKGETYNYVTHENNDTWLDIQYGLHASRAGASSLYFARPVEAQRVGEENTPIIITDNGGYKNELVTAANRLHNEFVGGSEYLSAWGGCVINGRKLGDKYGAYIVNLHDATNVSVKIACEGGYLPDGTYTNLVTGTDVTITDGIANIAFGGTWFAAVLISK